MEIESALRGPMVSLFIANMMDQVADNAGYHDFDNPGSSAGINMFHIWRHITYVS